MKLKIFADKKYLLNQPNVRPNPMLLPFWADFAETGYYSWMKNYDRYSNIANTLFEMVSLEEADIAVMPDDWRTVVGELWYANQNKLADSLYRQFAEKVAQANKKLVVFFGGDRSDEPVNLPNKDMLVFRYSYYRSQQKENNFVWPVFCEDLVEHYLANQLSIRQKSAKPVVGFCGLVKPSNWKTNLKKLSYYGYMLSRYRRLGYPPIQGHILREKVIKNFKKSNLVTTNFLVRESMVFLGQKNLVDMAKLRVEFIDNMINSDYIVCCRGAGNYSNRLFETLCLGRIPIFIDTDCVLPYNFTIDWKKYCVWIEEKEIDRIAEKVAEFHQNLSEEDFVNLQHECRRFWKEWLSAEGFYSNFNLHLP
ncbi:exostosin family protein [Aerosakkonemataceae cyanobacterium BLCC-F154]|uniref:Exostosin family protein n=1 Tax=Floridaenema fluviatile BLCC-F154 TaxID=3153640 RepID=A0ABV4YLD8_9CYAN